MNNSISIQLCNIEHLDRYGEIYAAAFSGEPWNASWKVEDAVTHIKELMQSKQFYGLECTLDDKIVGFILGTSMMYFYGRVFEISDLAVDPAYQRCGIAKQLIEQFLTDIKEQNIVGVNLITAAEGSLPAFYERFGFNKENEVILMGMDL